MRRSILLVLVLVGVVAGLSLPAHGKTEKPTKVVVERLFPRRVFGQVQHAVCVKDPKGDWGFFNGQPAGRHDPYVDIRLACAAYVKGTPALLARLEARLPCGPTADALVVCPAGNPPIGPGTEGIVLYSMELGGRAPREAPPDETGRYQLFLYDGNDPATTSQPTPEGPDTSSQGSNVTYQVVFNTPGTNPLVPLELFEEDRRRPGFEPTTARVWIRGRLVTFAVPESEYQLPGVESKSINVRGTVYWASISAPGDASLGNHDVAPGGVHAPYDFITLNTTG